jgi:hypothetical protein
MASAIRGSGGSTAPRSIGTQEAAPLRSHSPGWWDLIWTDRTRGDAYPGKTNQDLVWMVVDWDEEQVVVGIPWCSAALGYGYGTDTVLVKFHVRTGGFTRQVFTGVQFTAADYVRREGQFNAVKFMGTPTAGQATVQRYGIRRRPTSRRPIPAVLPSVTFGEYAQFGAERRRRSIARCT